MPRGLSVAKQTYLYYFWGKMRFSVNKTVENFEEIDGFEVEHANDPRKHYIRAITPLPDWTLNVGVNYSQVNKRIYNKHFNSKHYDNSKQYALKSSWPNLWTNKFSTTGRI